MTKFNTPTTIASISLLSALLGLSACGSPNTVANETAQQNAAEIAADAARMSASEMHNEMSQEGRNDRTKDDQTMGRDQDHMGMGNMKSGSGMSGGMSGMGGNAAANMQSMPQDKNDAPMPMKDEKDDM